jgi:hypothetical protein
VRVSLLAVAVFDRIRLVIFCCSQWNCFVGSPCCFGPNGFSKSRFCSWCNRVNVELRWCCFGRSTAGFAKLRAPIKEPLRQCNSENAFDSINNRKSPNWRLGPISTFVLTVVCPQHSGSWDKQILAWNAGTLSFLGRLPSNHSDAISCLAYVVDVGAENRQYIVSGSMDASVALFQRDGVSVATGAHQAQQQEGTPSSSARDLRRLHLELLPESVPGTAPDSPLVKASVNAILCVFLLFVF